MSNSECSQANPKRAFAVNMSREAITQSLREAAELNELGLSLAQAKPMRSPSGQPLGDAIREDRTSLVVGKSTSGSGREECLAGPLLTRRYCSVFGVVVRGKYT